MEEALLEDAKKPEKSAEFRDEDEGFHLDDESLSEIELSFGAGASKKTLLCMEGVSLKKLSQMSTK
jgi:hypothetical protein